MQRMKVSGLLLSKIKANVADSLREINLRYDSLIEQMAEGVYTINTTGTIEFTNTAFGEMLGYTSVELLDQSIFSYIHESNLSVMKKIIKNPSAYAVKKYEVTMLNKSGKEVYTLITPQMLVDEDDVYQGCFAVVTDITNQKKNELKILQLNQELAGRIEQLEASNKELEAFSYSVSHDLRAPLRHINGYVDLLRSKYQILLPEKGIYYMDTITDSARQMGTLIDDLLEFSRTGRNEVRATNYDMDLMVQDAIRVFDREIINRHIVWKVSNLPSIPSDYVMIKLVWTNLISNALKFTSKLPKAEIEIGFIPKEGEIVYYVKDNGVGFDMKYAQKLFGVFQRMHTDAEFEGTGIGLANVRRIIAKHGGKTWAEAEPEQGATFYFTIPRKGGLNE